MIFVLWLARGEGRGVGRLPTQLDSQQRVSTEIGEDSE